MPCSVVSPVPQDLTVLGVSPVCAVCAVVSWPLHPLGQSFAEAFFACCGQCLVPGFNVAHFN